MATFMPYLVFYQTLTQLVTSVKNIIFPFVTNCNMKSFILSTLCFLLGYIVSAQRIEQGYDYNLKPTQYIPRYYAIIEKQDTLWHRQVYFWPEKTMYLDGWYKDKACTVEEGPFVSYHDTRYPKSKGQYLNGRMHGTWLTYSNEGILLDSATYVNGHLTGIRLGWFKNGMASDSSTFDGNGNGVEVRWYDDGHPMQAGYWEKDTLKKGKWQYFHTNGKLKATEEYIDGKKLSCHCFDEDGKPLDDAICQEKEAEFNGGTEGWIQFLQTHLNPSVPVNMGAPYGQFTVLIQFVVDKDGTLSSIQPLTKFGFGMEEEAVRMLKQSPKWIPAQQFGKKVKAYRRQPITFVISK